MKKIINAFLFAFILCFISVQSSIRYIDRGLTGGFIPYKLRDKVNTIKTQDSVSYSQYREQGSHSNKANKATQSFTFSYSVTNTRTFSMGAGITKEILGLEVSATIGGEISYSQTRSISSTANIPGGKVGVAYLRDKIRTTKYRHVVQRQKTDIKGNWVNVGSETTSYSTVTTKTPEIKVDIKNN